MTDQRPTPEQIKRTTCKDEVLDRLEAEGYVIVHPDDVPKVNESAHVAQHGGDRIMAAIADEAWNACRRHIFGDDA